MIDADAEKWLRVPHARTLLRLHAELYENRVDINLDAKYRCGGLRSLDKVKIEKEVVNLSR